MKSLNIFLNRVGHDESGAAMVEYTILVGIVTVAIIATVALVGDWVSAKWTLLNTNLSGN
jgi:pilus assembly protein Flp/PilA